MARKRGGGHQQLCLLLSMDPKTGGVLFQKEILRTEKASFEEVPLQFA